MRIPRMGRRAFLRGAGVSLALPWLETVAARLPAALRAPPRRLCVARMYPNV